MVVERLGMNQITSTALLHMISSFLLASGKMLPVITGGYFVAVPIIDNIRFCVDMRERAISIRPQSSITKDNVHVQVSGNLYCQFTDAEKAAYGCKNPIYAVR